MFTLANILAFVLSALAAVFLIFLLHRTGIVLKFSYSPCDWLGIILLSSVLFLFAFLTEFSFSMSKHDNIVASSVSLLLLKSIIDNGLWIPIICLLLALFFNKYVELMNLDYLPAYDKKIPAICLSLISFSTCVVIFVKFFCLNSFSIVEKPDYIYLLNRIIIWIATSISTFFGFGCGYSGRLTKEIKAEEALTTPLEKKIKAKKDVSNIAIPIAISIIVYLVVIFLTFQEKFIIKHFTTIVIAFITFAVLFFSLAIIYRIVTNPSTDRSTKVLTRALDSYEKSKKKTRLHRFGKNKYWIENNTVKVYKVNIKYKDCPDIKDFERLFGEDEFPFLERGEARDFLLNRKLQQDEYITNAFKECTERKKQEKKESLKKNGKF